MGTLRPGRQVLPFAVTLLCCLPLLALAIIFAICGIVLQGWWDKVSFIALAVGMLGVIGIMFEGWICRFGLRGHVWREIERKISSRAKCSNAEAIARLSVDSDVTPEFAREFLERLAWHYTYEGHFSPDRKGAVEPGMIRPEDRIAEDLSLSIDEVPAKLRERAQRLARKARQDFIDAGRFSLFLWEEWDYVQESKVDQRVASRQQRGAIDKLRAGLLEIQSNPNVSVSDLCRKLYLLNRSLDLV